MKFSVLIGSHARGDANQYSDCDVLLINTSKMDFDEDCLPIQARKHVNYIDYDSDTFLRLHEIGSLFVYHVLHEGMLLSGSLVEWRGWRESFSVQTNYLVELDHIVKVTDFLSRTGMFGGKYLTPLVNAFTEIKNACIFYLAHNGVYEFNKMKCFDACAQFVDEFSRIKELKRFYDYSVRGMSLELPFNPNDEDCKGVLEDVHVMARRLRDACK
ncbi:hypothetical protein D4A39_08280 [Alcanivorax profundi]|uniref:Nucleotidyltransferase domain-containing protein n=1 Tax=Alcanivorax profundi TaxID=2338368 RepID=A0A418XZK2_9GAMM|nr:hypothetical protein [Alcanivorax profundi]RJG18455.1 hypothetical protein D4A39_08280 [Alcanivorax profundi]